MQNRKRDADIENGRVTTEEEREGGADWEIEGDVRTLPCLV